MLFSDVSGCGRLVGKRRLREVLDNNGEVLKNEGSMGKLRLGTVGGCVGEGTERFNAEVVRTDDAGVLEPLMVEFVSMGNRSAFPSSGVCPPFAASSSPSNSLKTRETAPSLVMHERR